MRVVSNLDKLTLYYWRVSKAYYGKSDEVMSFEKAARYLGAILYNAANTHKVSDKAFNLRKEMIRGPQ